MLITLNKLSTLEEFKEELHTEWNEDENINVYLNIIQLSYVIIKQT